MNPNINIQINITYGWTEMKSVYSNHLPSFLLFSLLISFYSEHILTWRNKIKIKKKKKVLE